MRNFNKRINNVFLKNVLLITSGTAFAQILGIALSPIITRLYSPEEYGILALYIAVLSLLSLFGSMNYEMGIPIAKNDVRAINILISAILLLSGSFFTLSFILFIWGKRIFTYLDATSLINYIYLIPIGLLLLGLYNIFTQFALRNKDFKLITKTKISQAIFQNVVSITFGFLGNSGFGLLIGKVVGQSTGITTLSIPLIKNKKLLLKEIKLRRILWSFKRYINFSLYTTPRRFLGDLTIALPVLFLTGIHGVATAGLFGLANSVIQLPMSLIGSSISSVFYAESATLKNKNPQKVKELSNKLLRNLILIGLLPLVILLFAAPFLFSLIFGEGWREAGVFASILSVSVFSRFIFKPISNIFDVYEKQKIALVLNIVRLIMVLIIFSASNYLLLTPNKTVAMYSCGMAIIYFLEYFLAQKIMNNEIKMVESKFKNK